ncbi:MAG: hypothetical protein Q9178_005850 [Gyalolechia marmorata]
MPPSPQPSPFNNSPPAITSTPPPDVLQAAEETLSPQTPPDTSNTSRILRIGTRASALAIAQVDIFTSILATLHPTLPTKTIPISVAGDRDKITNLHTLAQTGKSLWTEELEVLLLKGEIDCIVHSLKDVPTKVVAGCEVKIVGERGERRDCVVFPRRESTRPSTTDGIHDEPLTGREDQDGNNKSRGGEVDPGTSDTEPSPKKRKISSHISPSPSTPPPPSVRRLADLPPNSVVGTSSIRRSAMIRRCYPTLRIQDVRGNVGTRLRKLDDPAHGYDCLILAAAGIQRIGFGDRISEWLDPGPEEEEQKAGDGQEKETGKGPMLHAVGQGAIGLEIREGDAWVSGLLAGRDGHGGVVVNRVSWECQAERSLLRTLEGGCSVPVGVSCWWDDDDARSDPSSTAAGRITIPVEEDTTGAESTPANASNDRPASSFPPSTSSTSPPLGPTSPTSVQMTAGTLRMRASVTSVDGTLCVAATRKQWVSNDHEADEAGWEVARMLVEGGAAKILEGINLNRAMVERGNNA